MRKRRGPNHTMDVEFLDEGKHLIARPQGRMEAADGNYLASAVEERVHASTATVTIDLSQLDFVNFGGIRSMLRLGRSLKTSGKVLEFVQGSEEVRDALDQAGLDDLFAFTPPFISNRGTNDETP